MRVLVSPEPRALVLLCFLLACDGTFEAGVHESREREQTNSEVNGANASAEDAGAVDTSPEPPITTEPPPAPVEPPAIVDVGELNAESRGPLVVGTMRIELTVASGRTLPVQLWYPSVESARAEANSARSIVAFEPEGPRRNTLDALVRAAPEVCTNKSMHAADAPTPLPQASTWPLVVFSHCTNCTRFSAFSSAELMASWGIVVAAPDHEGGTLYDAQAGTAAGETSAFLRQRERDLIGVIDHMLDAQSLAVPEGLRGKIDPARLGVFGHSFGSVTAALAMQNDPRLKAGVFVAAPPENQNLGEVDLRAITQPALFLLAREDNVITETGNTALRGNYETYPNEAWLVEVSDAGHFSFSDLCALTGNFKAGCGDALRQTSPSASFSYVDNAIARGIAGAYTLAYFARELLQDPIAAEYLKAPRPKGYVTIVHHQ